MYFVQFSSGLVCLVFRWQFINKHRQVYEKTIFGSLHKFYSIIFSHFWKCQLLYSPLHLYVVVYISLRYTYSRCWILLKIRNLTTFYETPRPQRLLYSENVVLRNQNIFSIYMYEEASFSTKSQIILKGLFGILGFFQKTNEQLRF